MPIFQNFQNILQKIGFYGVKTVVFIGFFGCKAHFYATFGPRHRSADFGLGELGITAVSMKNEFATIYGDNVIKTEYTPAA